MNQAPENHIMAEDQKSPGTSNTDGSNTELAKRFKEGLDDVINVNALFTSAVFIGLSFSSSTATLETREECKADLGIAKRLVVFEIVAFGFFLVSSLVGKALKMQLYVIREYRHDRTIWRAMMVACSTCTVLGSFFLFLSIINVLQLRLGKLTCKGIVWIGAGSLIILYTLAFLIWLPSLFVAQRAAWNLDFLPKQKGRDSASKSMDKAK